MMQQYLKELEQEPFDHEEFVERLAWRTIETFRSDNCDFDPVTIHDTFLQAIKDLQLLQARQQKKCTKLEQECAECEKSHWLEVSKLQERNKAAFDLFHELDERINYVATKVIHLGDQLENVNTPRSRAVEAQRLMSYYAEFSSPGPIVNDVFTDKDRLFEAANTIQKLHLISQELPMAKFEEARKKIAAKYDDIERALIEEFVRAQRLNDTQRMKDIAAILSHFKGYSQVINAFIEQSQFGFNSKDIFKDIYPLTLKNYELMKDVFNNPEQVLAKFVLNIFHLKLQKHIVLTLADTSDPDTYLKNLMDLYSQTKKIAKDLSQFDMGSDDDYLNKLIQNIFVKYIDTYMSNEIKRLKDKCNYLLNKFYYSKDHQKKQLQSGGFQGIRRELQVAISARANINIGGVEDFGGETFLSEELAVSILQEARSAYERCQVLSKSPLELPSNAYQIFDVVLTYLIVDHVDYAVELGLNSVPIPENRPTPPTVHFFKIVHQANSIVHLFEKQYVDSLLPFIIDTPKLGESAMRKKPILSLLEEKLDNGIDRSLNAIVGWIKIYLTNEQKKVDFKPETEINIMSSAACKVVVQYLASNIQSIQSNLDGKNSEFVLTELGVRFHKVLYEQITQFQYNSAGAMSLICDMNEYRKVAKTMGSSLVNTLFDTMHALCNLLLVKPENLNEVCSDDQLVVLDRSILLSFIQLRADCKSQKLTNFLKGIISGPVTN